MEAVASAAAALCGRKDIPRAMEGTLAILLARELRAGDGGAVASVKRELGGKWATIMVVNQCAVAWLCALLVRLVAVVVF